MPSFRITRWVRHSPQQMYDLVADVEHYPEFLPLCESLRVLRRQPGTGEGTEVLVAEMGVGYKAIRERFTTRVGLDRPNLKITAEYIDGPFRHLENRWAFKPGRDGGCDVDFFITYEFKSFALGLLMGKMFDRAFRKFTDAFESRADRVYGRA
ncbi:type II toxin-antitoxin system RatA family toxin [Methylobacterium sp. E-041]|jgi:coenzyme Q-binding protein COQ10|uniref:type II toxin-antitoxin system RatA family toxin n=1 Tax=unclassified Methylobacterium TaxID=2615210 RepID=UPI0011CA1B9E|nr:MULTISPECIES: type II toxin-antitoxin system RatA family toxin [unclassified Methylobacterium]MCJ2009000.1 type II toxin-antitoxin system RatA family toxin [Methylobacterium sp. J-092]MCJ2039631.1 type II toxin-antitoxin system RatA family toxin [Methylobacterium sp. J-059]MCJ2077431.1 type II toxin-antitoxin system RatA family toxin [Methylobacterium sp. E-016]MCJ2105937.1 type II toxin-antitoxin system RatA family toxin [Methylobacterium sp. E-041]TXN24540.1 type II toxin-antitoxin system